MKFSDFIQTGAIKASIEAGDKPGVIRELVEGLTASGAINPADQESVIAAILKREELGSTSIGRGIAVPHTKHPSVSKLIGAVGVSHEGVDFDSLDGDKVHLFFLVVSPLDRPADHLRALENTAARLRDDTFCRFLKQAQNVQNIKLLLDEADQNQFSG